MLRRSWKIPIRVLLWPESWWSSGWVRRIAIHVVIKFRAKSAMQPFPDPSRPTVKRGEYIFLKIQNNSSQALNVAVLDLASDWSIEQIFPGEGENFYNPG